MIYILFCIVNIFVLSKKGNIERKMLLRSVFFLFAEIFTICGLFALLCVLEDSKYNKILFLFSPV